MTDYSTEIVVALREKAKLGSKTFQMLVNELGSPEDIISAEYDDLVALPRISKTRAETILNIENHLDTVKDNLLSYRESGVETMTIFDDNYPSMLKDTGDPPFVLYYKGNFPVEKNQYVAIVGTTQASSDAIANMVEYAKAVSKKGAVIVSGLARGIDTSAHIGAIKSEGMTYAVLGCGIFNIYPPENKRLAEEILEFGALISEYPPDMKVTTGRLIARNRIIVGLSHSLVIGEIDKKSRGTLDTAEKAKRLGKMIFAVGDSNNPVDPGLVKFGAIPLEDIRKADLITDYSF